MNDRSAPLPTFTLILSLAQERTFATPTLRLQLTAPPDDSAAEIRAVLVRLFFKPFEALNFEDFSAAKIQQLVDAHGLSVSSPAPTDRTHG